MWTVGFLVFTLCLPSGWAFMDACTLYPRGFLPSNETEVVVPSPSCLQGVIDWGYPKGTIDVKFNQPHSFILCLNDWIGGSVFTIYDNSFGQMTLLKTLSDEQECIRSNGQRANLIVKAPPQLLYMGGFNFEIKEQ